MSVYLYVIHCLDDLSCGMVENGTRFGGCEKRMSIYKEHKVYQGSCNDPSSPTYIKKICAGPMESEDGKFMIGSMFIVESTREAAERFIKEDPFSSVGVWKQVSINRYISIPNGIKEVSVEMDDAVLSTVRMVVK